jgi:hypothetical protein
MLSLQVTSVLLSPDAWQRLVGRLEDAEDREILSKLAPRSAQGLGDALRWSEVEREWAGVEVEPLVHPVVERLPAREDRSIQLPGIALTDPEVEKLAGILERGFAPVPALRAAIHHLTDEKRSPPKLRWKKNAGG